MNGIPYINSIFQQSWWLDAVAPGQWHDIVIKKGNEIVARLPYIIKKKYGLTLLTMPFMTQSLGPWIKSSEAKYDKQISQQKELLNELIKQLPRHDYFSQNFHYSITNWLPFYWKGFTQTTRYTYVIEDLSDMDKVWEGMSAIMRNQIRKAEKSGIKVGDTDDIETFLDLNEKTFKRQGLSLPYSRDFIRHLNTACMKNNARKIYITYGPDGSPHTGLFCVFDENSMYNLMQGGDPELRNSGANALAMWESIKFAAKVSKVYDFEGSMIESIERFYRDFGAIQKPYFQISKIRSGRMKILMSGRDLLKALINKS